MVLLLRHSAEIIRGRTGPTRECDNPVNREKRLRLRGLEGDRQSFWVVATTSLPLSAARSASQCSIGYPGREKRFHRQVAPPVDCAGSSASAAGVHFHQRLGRASPATGAGAIQNPWLRADASQECVAKSTICLIVMCFKRCHKFINGWCLSQNAAQLKRSAN
jgi:hypothetical protein